MLTEYLHAQRNQRRCAKLCARLDGASQVLDLITPATHRNGPQFSREQAPLLATADAYRASWQARKAFTAASVPARLTTIGSRPVGVIVIDFFFAKS